MTSRYTRQSAGRIVLVLASLTVVSWLAQPDSRTALGRLLAGPPLRAQELPPAPPAPGTAQGDVSEAERVARLQRSLASNRKQIEDITRQLQDPASTFNQADAEFRRLDDLLAAKSAERGRLAAKGKIDPDLEAAVRELQRQRQLARDRFDLEIEARKARQQKLAALKRLVNQDQQALDQLTGAAREVRLLSGLVKVPACCKPGGKHHHPPSAAASTPANSPPGSSEPSSEPAAEPAKKEDRKLTRAREQARTKEAAARAANRRAQSLDQRIAALRQNLEVERRLLANGHKQLNLARQAHDELERELKRRSEQRAPEAELASLRKQAAAAAQRVTESEKAVEDSTQHVTELQTELTGLQAEHLAAQREATTKQREAEAAEKKVTALESPFTPHNLLRWLIQHGPRLLVILAGMFLVHRLVLLLTRRVVRLVAHGQRQHGRLDEEDRAETLVGVFRNTASVMILGGGTLMLLDEVGIPIVPLMGGAAVFGLAVAFGAQNLIKDYFSGFMVLLEDQYAVNDFVRIGDVEGKVERISLRITVLRDANGAAHFIPHGTITTVTNMTHGFSRAFFEIGVAYKEDADHVMAVLLDLAHELRRDEEFGPMILEDPEMLGVDSFDDSSVVIKFFINTRPMKQARVKRELLRRIKRRFDELGIEIPFPHRTVYHRYEEGQAPAQRPHGTEDNPRRRVA